MDELDKIQSMCKSGKITKEQAQVLESAFTESQERSAQIFNSAKKPKKQRKNIMYCMNFFLLIFFIVTILFGVNVIKGTGNNSPKQSSVSAAVTRAGIAEVDTQKDMPRRVVIAFVFSFFLLIIFAGSGAVVFVLVYNGLASSEEAVDKAWIDIQEQLKLSEDEIVGSIKKYNNKVIVHNTLLRCFPSNIVANIFSFRSRNHFKREES